ncbi:hypothetical protein [Streptomyces sp. NPDC095613]|uniref:hypothetical protein n=1 Tax=Streptomyces sp. NPDC095613 TaxID=3155540 RepID=UPI0033211942
MTDSQETSRIKTRTVHRPGGGRVVVAYDSTTAGVETMSDEEFLTRYAADAGGDVDDGQVDEVTAARIRRAKRRLLEHPAGEPFQAADIAPFLRDPGDAKAAQAITESLNRYLNELEDHDDRPPGA